MDPKLFLMMTSLTLGGCTIFPTVATIDEHTNPTPSSKVAPAQVAALKPGSSVQIFLEVPNTVVKYNGTVLHASVDGIALLNCEISVRHDQTNPKFARIPHLNRLYKTSGWGKNRAPVQWVSIRQISGLEELAPPPPGYIAPQLDIDTNDESFFEREDFDFNVVP